jgi:hypothetical protein
VIYCGFLPDVPLNRAYAARQWNALVANRAPPAYEEAAADKLTSDRDWPLDSLSATQDALLGKHDAHGSCNKKVEKYLHL